MRRAVIDIAGDAIAESIGFLEDAGYRIVSSMNSDPWISVARLVIEGEGLPDECDKELRIVTPIFYLERYGKQKLVRLHEITLGPPVERRD